MAVLNGNDSDNTLTLSTGIDTVQASGGEDKIIAASYLTSADKIDGGIGYDTLSLAGNYLGLVFNATTLKNVEYVHVASGFDYNITTHDATVAAGEWLHIDVMGGNA